MLMYNGVKPVLREYCAIFFIKIKKLINNFAEKTMSDKKVKKNLVKPDFKILHVQKLFQPIVLGLDCDTFTARCWEEC